MLQIEINSEEEEQNANPLLQILDENDLERNLDDGDDAVDDVELDGEVDDVAVEDAGDDGEDHVHESEHGGETKQLDVLENAPVKVKLSRAILTTHGHQSTPAYAVQA